MSSTPTEQEMRSVRSLMASGILTSQAGLLLSLLCSDTGSVRIGTLAADLGWSIPRVSMLGDTMVKQGLVDRTVPVSDQRKVALALTEKGYELARTGLRDLRRFSGGAESEEPGKIDSPSASE